jgi:3-oxoacyl-[acyl-carrier-protein] synthase-3
VYLHGISYVVGDKRAIAEIPELAAQPSLLDDLHGLGLRYYRHATESVLELAGRAVAETLRTASVPVGDIDVVILASSSVRFGQVESGEFVRFAERFGLTRATPIGVSLSECANFGSALRVARGLVAVGEVRNVLVVTADACTGSDQRLNLDVRTVISDGAAACLVGTGTSRIEVIAASQGTNQLIRVATKGPAIGGLTRQGVSRVVGDLLDRAGVAREDIQRVIPNNVNEEAGRFMADSAGLDHSLCYLDNLADYAHVHSCDNLINLQTYLEDGVAPDETVLTMSHGFGTWGTALLRIH